MRFLQIVMSKGGRSGPPTPEHLERLRKITSDEIASGTLLAKGALRKRATDAARITSHGGVELIQVTEMHPRPVTSS